MDNLIDSSWLMDRCLPWPTSTSTRVELTSIGSDRSQTLVLLFDMRVKRWI